MTDFFLQLVDSSNKVTIYFQSNDSSLVIRLYHIGSLCMYIENAAFRCLKRAIIKDNQKSLESQLIVLTLTITNPKIALYMVL